jgi:hypothetical protein
MELGYEVRSCRVDLGEETAESVVSDILSGEKFDCIMIGAGIKGCRSIPFCLRKQFVTIQKRLNKSNLNLMEKRA